MTWQRLILMLEPIKILQRPLNTHMGLEKPYTAEILKTIFFWDTLYNLCFLVNMIQVSFADIEIIFSLQNLKFLFCKSI